MVVSWASRKGSKVTLHRETYCHEGGHGALEEPCLREINSDLFSKMRNLRRSLF
jgi:hypothetical protein